jgi:hypothetical protein
MKNISILIFIIFILSRCSVPSHIPADSRYSPPGNGDLIEKSLFNSPDRTISEEDIQKLLKGRIKVPDTIRIAIFNYSTYSQSNYYYNYYQSWNDEELLKTQQQYIDTLRSTISSSPKVQKIILMPSIMANEKSTITNLREMAVRLQADYLMIYAIKSDIFYKYKAFSADEAKAFATCETLLMDTRTGLIPYTTIVTKEKFAKKVTNDLTIQELRKRAESEAIIKSLISIGFEIADYFNRN